MGSLIYLADYRQARSSSSPKADHGFDDMRRQTAYAMINQAASLLSDLGEKERRIAWILEDCIELLEQSSKTMSL